MSEQVKRVPLTQQQIDILIALCEGKLDEDDSSHAVAVAIGEVIEVLEQA